VAARLGARPSAAVSGISARQHATLLARVAGLAVSPDLEEDKTIAVTTYVKGAFVSEDGGGTWGFANEGLTVDDCGTGKRFAPLRRLGGVVLSPDYAKDGTIFGADWVAQHDPSSGRRL
jgi:hypothetical protein